MYKDCFAQKYPDSCSLEDFQKSFVLQLALFAPCFAAEACCKTIEGNTAGSSKNCASVELKIPRHAIEDAIEDLPM